MIQIENIYKSFKGRNVLDNVNLIVSGKSIQALLGSNGAGKSTLIQIISGFMRAKKGDITINQILGDNGSSIHRNKIGYVFERPLYIEKFSAYEYLTFVCELHSLNKQVYKNNINEIMEFFDLPKDKKYIESYSKGMKAKVSLAAALIHKPEYLILDEPFDGIDFVSIQKITKLFKDMAAKGCTILITSHQYDIISSMCDKFALLKDGQIIFNKTLPELEIDAQKVNKTIKEFLESIMGNTGSQTLSWVQ